MSLVDLSGLYNLYNNSVRMQDLDQNLSGLLKNDFFVVEKRLNASNTQTTKINYSNLSGWLLDGIRTSELLSLTGGDWILSNGNSMSVDTVGLVEAHDPDAGRVAVNLEYLHDVLEAAVYRLSSTLYGPDAIIPSYVGQIITSRTLNTIAKVKARYGTSTSWESIAGHFVMAAGQTAPQTNNYIKFGTSVIDGSSTTLSSYTAGTSLNNRNQIAITANNIPVHSHGFKASSCPFSLTWQMEVKGPSYYPFEQPSRVNTRSNVDEGNGIKTLLPTQGTFKRAGLNQTFSGSGTLDTTKFFTNDNQKIISGIYNLTNGSNVSASASEKHNNVPLFRTEYIWRRIS